MSSAGPFEPEVNRSLVVNVPSFNDIGALLDPEKSLHKICDLASNLFVDGKSPFLYNHIVPPAVPHPTPPHTHSLIGKMNRSDKGLPVNRHFFNWFNIGSALVIVR